MTKTRKPEVTTGTRNLPVLLTDEELLRRGKRIAAIEEDIGRVEYTLTSAKGQHKAEVTRLEGERAQLSRDIRNGYEHRSVEVEVRHDYRAATVVTSRTDTGEVIDTRTMTIEERQVELELELAEAN